MINKKFLTVFLAVSVFTSIISGCAGNLTESNANTENVAASVVTEELDEDITEERQDSADTEVIDGVEIVNSYDNTSELMEKFPVINKTELRTDLENDIANRLLTGFENWNRGFDAWKAWGSILYTDDSIYNVHGARMTLAEYQAAMDVTLQKIDLKMGAFNNMLIVDDWAAIFYDITTNGNPGTTMEFVNFKDYGDELGVRVVEGWGGPKTRDAENMAYFQSEEEVAAGKAAWTEIAEYKLPDTDDLEEKYIIKNPTTIDEGKGAQIKEKILEDFEHWNTGVDDYAEWTEKFYSKDAVYHEDGSDVSIEDLREAITNDDQSVKTTKLYFDNMLIRDDWAAIHYRALEEDTVAGEKEAVDRMEFLHFGDVDGEIRVIEQWVK